MNDLTILCIGGDARFLYMCRYLAQRYRVYAFGTAEASEGVITADSLSEFDNKFDVLVLPMMNNTVNENGRIGIHCSGKTLFIDSIIPLLKKDAVVTGGLADDITISAFSDKGYDLTDYFKRRELVIKNCIPTAEGALCIAMQERNETVFGSKVLITGFGNVSKAAAKLFSACGADVTCAVRRTDAAAEAECCGYRSADIHKLKEYIGEYDIVINTVPACIIDAEVLKSTDRSALVIDLASRPGGVDIDAAKKAKIRCIHALALPGKAAPATAGRYIAETVENIISERRG